MLRHTLRSLYHSRRAATLAFSILILLPIYAHGQLWRGQVSHQGKPVAGATVTICEASTRTNNSGRFRLEAGDSSSTCEVVVEHAELTSTVLRVRSKPYLNLYLKRGPSGWILESR